jgi:DNA-directed RNA polymerase subunit M/transcription elongation factor TFIIS
MIMTCPNLKRRTFFYINANFRMASAKSMASAKAKSVVDLTVSEAMRTSIRGMLTKDIAKICPGCDAKGAATIATDLEAATYKNCAGNRTKYVTMNNALNGVLNFSPGEIPNVPLAARLLAGQITPVECLTPTILNSKQALENDPRLGKRRLFSSALLKAKTEAHPQHTTNGKTPTAKEPSEARKAVSDDAKEPSEAKETLPVAIFQKGMKNILLVAAALEKSCYNAVINGVGAQMIKTWQSEPFVNAYTERCCTVYAHIDPDGAACKKYGTELRDKLLSGEIDAKTVGTMSAEQLCPAAFQKVREKLEERKKQKIQEKASTLFPCPKCHARCHTMKTAQTRSADELAKNICKCLKCGTDFSVS